MDESKEIEIVVVEDDPNDAELVTRVLKKKNLANKLIHLRDGVEALDYMFAQGSFAGRKENGAHRVVLLDIKLPKIDGIEVLRKLKGNELTRKVPVVILSASKEERDLKIAYELGVNSYVAKPMRFEDFVKVVSDLGLYWLLINRLPARLNGK